MGDRAQSILMIEERAPALRHGNRFIDPRAMRVAGLKDVRAVVFQQNVLAVIDVGSAECFLNAPSQSIIAIGARKRRRGIPSNEVLDLRQSVLGVVRVLGKVAGGEQGLARQVAVVIVLIAVRRIRGELIPGVDDAAARCSVAHWVIGEALWRGQQRMARTGQPIQRIIAEALRAAPIRQTGPIPHRVVEIVGFINLGTRGGELVEDLGDLTGGIV